MKIAVRKELKLHADFAWCIEQLLHLLSSISTHCPSLQIAAL